MISIKILRFLCASQKVIHHTLQYLGSIFPMPRMPLVLWCNAQNLNLWSGLIHRTESQPHPDLKRSNVRFGRFDAGRLCVRSDGKNAKKSWSLALSWIFFGGGWFSGQVCKWCLQFLLFFSILGNVQISKTLRETHEIQRFRRPISVEDGFGSQASKAGRQMKNSPPC